MKPAIAATLMLAAATAGAATTQESAAQGVLARLIGGRANQFRFVQSPPSQGLDWYAVKAKGGVVEVRGTTGVAMCRGAYDYLKAKCGILVTWDGDQVRLPKEFPDAEIESGPNPLQYRHYFNVCTFGYTTAFWDWKRWRREIDWMALHGINMPLAMNGLEKVWQTVWRGYGLTDTQIREHFVGPAFRPWQWMGNVDSHGGPLPQAWIDSQAKLQQQILDQEFALGMTPVTPAFASFIPKAFAAKLRPGDYSRSSGWCGFEPTYMLDPRNPLFGEIGERFIKEYKKQYGRTAGLYLADIYNEMSPQVSAETKDQELRAIAQAVHKSIKKGDPQGKWVMQGWLFYNERNFWHEPEIEAYLGGVPNQDMVLLDLAGEAYEVWRASQAFRGKPYIWNMLHNYGQNTVLSGNLANLAEKVWAARTDPNRGSLSGMGLTMEGIEQNAVQYELMCDLMWTTEKVDAAKWITQYGIHRYGQDSAAIRTIWSSTIGDIYLGRAQNETAQYTRRPSMAQVGEVGEEIKDARHRVEDLLALSQSLGGSKLWQRDLVDIAKRYGDYAVRASVEEVVDAIEGKDIAKVSKARSRFQTLMRDLDTLLATIPHHRMDRWIDQARATAAPQDKDLLEMNARLQVTVWGGPILYDYAAKEWSGLVWDFYRPRWERFFDELEGRPQKPGLPEWELAWTKQKGLPKPQASDPVTAAKKLLADGLPLEDASVDRGIAVGKPVTSDGGTEGAAVPGIVADGRASGRYWAAGPGPHWVQIDLQEPTQVSRIVVYPYVDGERYYQYTVSVSADGQNWQTVADMSSNREPSPRRGFTHRFPAVSARYVRVSMTFNSANPSMHLYEVRVFN